MKRILLTIACLAALCSLHAQDSIVAPSVVGGEIILEGEWNPELRNYLNMYRNLLGLPEPKRMIWTLEIY